MLRTPQATTAIPRARIRGPGIARRGVVRGTTGAASAGLLPFARARPVRAQNRHAAAPSSPEATGEMDSLLSPDGTRIAYQRAGNGPPLVLVHGTADDRACWAPVLPALEQRFTVYAVDRRGRGGSGGTDPSRFQEPTTPTLLLFGSGTAPFLKAATEVVAAALPHDRPSVLTGQGHLAIDTAPDLFLRAVVPFLTDEASAT